MAEEESFIVLGSTPTPSMEQYLRDGQDSFASLNSMMDNSTQLKSGNFSVIQAGESLKPGDVNSLQGKKSLPASVNMNGSVAAGNSLAASIIMGETKSSLLQTFPSLLSSTVSIDEVQALQLLVNEHGQMKDSLQKANVAMRKNFTNIQKWQDEVKVKYAEQIKTIDEQSAAIEGLQSENKALKQALKLAEERSSELDKRFQAEKLALQKELEETKQRIDVERLNATAELNELQKAVSEKQSILQNMAKQIERMELEKQEFVVVHPTKPEAGDGKQVEFIAKDEHNRQIKVLQREMSAIVAKNLEVEDMQKIYIDELNCLKINLTAAEEVHGKQRAELARQAKEIETKDVSLAENIRELKTLAEQVDVLSAQLDIYKVDFEAERSAREELASEKDRILSDHKLLQKRNQQLIDEVQNGRIAQEKATKAANEALDKRDPEPSGSGAATSAASSSEPAEPEEQQFQQRPVLHCPLCNDAFRDLATLQNHVEDCNGIE